jgi:hypothetical protein
VRDTIIQIRTYGSSNEIQSFIVVLVPLHLTIGHVVKCCQDHISFLNNLPDRTILAKELIVSSIFPVIEILVIENHKLDDIFLYVTFELQSLLRTTSDLTDSDRT